MHNSCKGAIDIDLKRGLRDRTGMHNVFDNGAIDRAVFGHEVQKFRIGFGISKFNVHPARFTGGGLSRDQSIVAEGVVTLAFDDD
jgi:hypothetical protein